MREQQLGSSSAGVWTRVQAAAVGLTAGEIRARLVSGRWQRPHTGVYADGGFVLDAQQRAWAAVLAAGPRSIAYGRTAARCWQLPLIDDDDPLTGRHQAGHDDVACGQALRDRPLLHAVRVAFRGPEVTALAGCPLTVPVRTLWDLTRLLSPEALVCAIDDALHRGLVTPVQLDAQAARRRGAQGVHAFRRAVALSDGRAESPLESLGRLALLPVLPQLVPQVEVRTPGGQVLARVDLGDERCRFAVEADGRTGHAGDRMVHRDRQRDAHLHTIGWQVEHIGWRDVRQDQAELRRRVLAAARRHAAAA